MTDSERYAWLKEQLYRAVYCPDGDPRPIFEWNLHLPTTAHESIDGAIDRAIAEQQAYDDSCDPLD